MDRDYYNRRIGRDGQPPRLSLAETAAQIAATYAFADQQAYLQRSFGYFCVDAHHRSFRVPQRNRSTGASRVMGLDAIGLRGEIALIIDSEMDNLDAFNDRSLPLVGDHVLPERVTMIYACGDRATEELIGNNLVATCDRIERAILQKVESFSPDQPQFAESRHGHHGKHRRWYWGPPRQA